MATKRENRSEGLRELKTDELAQKLTVLTEEPDVVAAYEVMARDILLRECDKADPMNTSQDPRRFLEPRWFSRR